MPGSVSDALLVHREPTDLATAPVDPIQVRSVLHRGIAYLTPTAVLPEHVGAVFDPFAARVTRGGEIYLVS